MAFYSRLSQLEKLQVLDLSVNPLRFVPEGVCDLTQITELRLTACQITDISDRYDIVLQDQLDKYKM